MMRTENPIVEETAKEELAVQTIRCERVPSVNVISQEDFQNRASVIFETLDRILGKSLGAYGAPTIISNFPYSHVTKDGFTIARNIEFGFRENDEVDRAIALMATDICARLNYAVGDGTTSAIIAVNQIYKSARNLLDTDKIRPKDLIAAFTNVRDKIITRLNSKATRITSENLVEMIRKVVHVSSNGDALITDLIVEAYETIGAPAITVEVSDGIETYLEITDGYRSKVRIADKLYINRDNSTVEHKNVDVIIFDHKITAELYHDIISPLVMTCRVCGRHLLCLAPWYDEVLLSGTIKRELYDEYTKTNDITLILASYLKTTEVAKKNINDLALLLNTEIIDKGLASLILESVHEHNGDVRYAINTTDRDIEGIKILATSPDGSTSVIDSTEYMAQKAELGEDFKGIADDAVIKLGFADQFNGGMKESTFKMSHYNPEIYDKLLDDAEYNLQEIIEKYSALGTYTQEVTEAETRLASLKMKTASIYVGGGSQMSRDMLQDSVVDAVRAAESAYQHGFVQGCNLTLWESIHELVEVETDPMQRNVLETLEDGFQEVYRRVLSNAFGNELYVLAEADAVLDAVQPTHGEASMLHAELAQYQFPAADESVATVPTMLHIIKSLDKIITNNTVNVVDVLIDISHKLGKVFDLETMDYSDNIVNSTKTDTEILTAVVDLLSLLVTGNQVLISGYSGRN